MKKNSLLVLLSLIFCLTSFSQNLISNGDFENVSSGFALDGSYTALMRVAGHDDLTTQTVNPTATATSVTNDMWVKKAPSSGYVKGLIRSDLSNPDGTFSANNVLNLRINQNTAIGGYTNWYQCVAQQRIGSLDLEKKYILTFDAKVDDESESNWTNICDKIVVFVRDIDGGNNLTQTVSLTKGSTWENYTATFNLPAWTAGAGAGSLGTNMIFGFGLSTEANDDNKTKFSAILIDNVVLLLEDNVPSGLSKTESTFTCIGSEGYIQINNAPENTKLSVYNLTGSLVAQKKSVSTNVEIKIPKGLYFVCAGNETRKVLVK